MSSEAHSKLLQDSKLLISTLASIKKEVGLARRENLPPLLTKLKTNISSAKALKSSAENAYNQESKVHNAKYSIFNALSAKKKLEYDKNVKPLKQLLYDSQTLLNKITELAQLVNKNCQDLQIDHHFKGGICHVYNPVDGKITTKTIWHGAVHGVFNPSTQTVEWKEKKSSGVHGVYNPLLKKVEWNEFWHGGVYGVFNPALGVVEWRNKWQHGICPC